MLARTRARARKHCSGGVYSWGRTESGRLGRGKGGKAVFDYVPRSIPTFQSKVRVGMLTAGAHHSLAITQQGELLTWGANAYGQLGLGHKKAVWTPTAVSFGAVCGGGAGDPARRRARAAAALRGPAARGWWSGSPVR